MNDLMTKSFLSYVDLKNLAQKDLEAEHDLEAGRLNPTNDQNLSRFFQEVAPVKASMEEIGSLLFDLQNLNEETKSTHSAKVLRGLRDRMESDIVSVLRKGKVVKASLAAIDKANVTNRRKSDLYKEGSPVDRTRTSVTNGLRVKLREIMIEFQSLRYKILADQKEDLKRKYYTATGEVPSEEMIESMVSKGERVQVCEGKTDLRSKERQEAVMDIQKSLTRLHQVFLDMAVLVEAQGEQINDIEENVATASNYISGGTNSLYYANQMRKKTKTWIYWVWAVAVIILLVCAISMLAT
ncbi:syntaxin-112-like [Tripterygium wilfordii]|uniref:syntaxin-112-like n=1 Tax=Tripterygium wilfordii TaxID=458696 RepID=UPI0018F84CF9|nr:syntaxin-112-like [Tripterygium wilfordii]